MLGTSIIMKLRPQLAKLVKIVFVFLRFAMFSAVDRPEKIVLKLLGYFFTKHRSLQDRVVKVHSAIDPCLLNFVQKLLGALKGARRSDAAPS